MHLFWAAHSPQRGRGVEADRLMRLHTNIRGQCWCWWWGGGREGVYMRGRVGACGAPLNGGHRSVEMRGEEQLTGDLVDHELPV